MCSMAGGRKVGAHDLLVQVVGDGRGGPATDAHPSGELSVEVKLRRLWSETGRKQTRRDVQRESTDGCEWWLRESKKFSGRLILMANFTQKTGNDFELRGEVKLTGETTWRALFGWQHSCWNIKAQPRTQERPAAKIMAAPKRAAAIVVLPRPTAAALSASQAKAVVDKLVFRGGFAEVKMLLRELGKNETKADYWSRKALSKHGWDNTSELFQKARAEESSKAGEKRKRLGGSDGWVAARRVLEQMAVDIPPAR